MPPTSITDLVFIDSSGYHYSDYPTFLAWITAQYQGIYGADVYIDPDSMDGQFLAILAQAFYDTAALGSSVYNSFSPLTSQGYGLSRLVQINGIQREIPSFSTVDLTLVGTAGTIITNGVASDTLNQQWILPTPTVIPDAGTVDVVATSAVVGAIFAEANTITNIFTPTNGWQTVNNAAIAVSGEPVETDAQLRVRQSQSTQLPALTVLGATQGAIANIPGVSDVEVYENDGSETDDRGITANSVCAVVAGSFDSTTVAQTIQLYKTPGVGTFGNTTVTVVDSRGMPLDISFTNVALVDPGAEIQVYIQYTPVMSGANQWSDDYVPLIQAAVAKVINASGIGALLTNGQINYTTLFAPAYLNGAIQGQSYVIEALEIGLNGGSLAASNIDIDFDQQPLCDPASDVTVSTDPP